MKNLCIIPARGGSKRIPRKNVKSFLGKPMLAYSIEAAMATNLFDEVMVSTDDDEIAEVARQYGAKVPFMRSSETANDFATTADVLHEVIDKYKELGREFDNFCCVYATAPMVQSKDIISAYNRLQSSDFTIVYPSMSCFAEWIGRCFIRDKRGESGCNPDVLYDNWYQWLRECEVTGCNHEEIVLCSGQHLSDYIFGKKIVL